MHAIRGPVFRISEIPPLETESKFHLRLISAEIVFLMHGKSSSASINFG